MQELLAPARVFFFDHNWNNLGERNDKATQISGITRIHLGALEDRGTICTYSIAQRMSWAANRQTTREEDIAYSLMGIFDVNLPFIYGIGPMAFERLQREIIEFSDDQSILAWELRGASPQPWTSALAPSPAEFRFCGSIVRDWGIKRYPYSITNLGISLELPLIKTVDHQVIIVGLNCAKELHEKKVSDKFTQSSAGRPRYRFQVWIPLIRLKGNIYLRQHHRYSEVFLGQSYLQLTSPKFSKMFLETNTSRLPSTHYNVNHVGSIARKPASSPSGVMLTIESGIMMPLGDMFKEIYPLGDFFIGSLKGRGKSTSSHQLLSSGTLATIISVYWDGDQQPLKWCHTTIVDKDMQVTRQMALDNGWRCLFGRCNHGDSIGCNTIAGLHSLHNGLRQMQGNSMDTFLKSKVDPMVSIGSMPLQDSHGDLELIAEITLRERLENY